MRFGDIIGQQAAKLRLWNMFETRHIPHALLFTGPDGCGSLPLSLAFAQLVLCDKPSDRDSCGNCTSCKRVNSLQHPDLHFSFPFFNITGQERTYSTDYWKPWSGAVLANPYLTIDSWRNEITNDNKQLLISVHESHQIIQKLSLKSFEGKAKIQIIWMAEYLKTDSANILLKILEEPPAGTIFMLVASSTEEMLATVLSRVQMIRLPSINDDDIRDALSVRYPSCNADEICHFASGDWNMAIQMVNQENPLGAFHRIFQEWMRIAFKKDLPSMLKWVDKMHAAPREEQKHFLRYAMDQIRQNLAMNYAGDEVVRMNPEEKAFASRFSKYINENNALRFYSVLQEAQYEISRNAYSKLLFADLTIKVHYLFLKGNGA
jgi:DNA polymerase-3 subunit delta'